GRSSENGIPARRIGDCRPLSGGFLRIGDDRLMAMTPLELLDTDSLIGDEDRAIRDTVRSFVEDKLKPEIAGWYDAGTAPVRELAKEFGSMGVLGIHPTGEGGQ